MNRSAKGGIGRGCTMEAKAFSFTHPHQGVCGRHGTEEQRATSGGLAKSPGGTGVSRPISESEVASEAWSVVGTAEWYLKRGESQVTGQPATELGRRRQPAKMIRKRKETR